MKPDWHAIIDRDLLRDTLIHIRAKLHAANRPTLREGLRLELRDLIDATLAKVDRP